MDEPAPVLRVVRGDPTEQELAALVALAGVRLTRAVATPARPSRPPRSRWRRAAGGQGRGSGSTTRSTRCDTVDP